MKTKMTSWFEFEDGDNLGFVNGDLVDVVERKATLDGDDVKFVGFFYEDSLVYFEIGEGDLDCISNITVGVTDCYFIRSNHVGGDAKNMVWRGGTLRHDWTLVQ